MDILQNLLLDTWRTSGLRGTGSHDFEVSDAFVPDGRSVVLGGRPRVDGPLFKFPTLGLLALGVTSVSLGIARRSIQEFIALAGGKVPTGSARTLANRPLAQRAVADAEASLRAARAFLFEVLDEVWAVAQQGALTTEARALLRLAATHSTLARRARRRPGLPGGRRHLDLRREPALALLRGARRGRRRREADAWGCLSVVDRRGPRRHRRGL